MTKIALRNWRKYGQL